MFHHRSFYYPSNKELQAQIVALLQQLDHVDRMTQFINQTLNTQSWNKHYKAFSRRKSLPDSTIFLVGSNHTDNVGFAGSGIEMVSREIGALLHNWDLVF